MKMLIALAGLGVLVSAPAFASCDYHTAQLSKKDTVAMSTTDTAAPARSTEDAVTLPEDDATGATAVEERVAE
jgi:hypothetical protein